MQRGLPLLRGKFRWPTCSTRESTSTTKVSLRGDWPPCALWSPPISQQDSIPHTQPDDDRIFAHTAAANGGRIVF